MSPSQSKGVELFLGDNNVQTCPELEFGRNSHSSCVVKNDVYVFGGQIDGDTKGVINLESTIERLSLLAPAEGWKTIELESTLSVKSRVNLGCGYLPKED